jgi:lycopene cyclase CruA
VSTLAEARSRVREAGGDELCERLEHLDAARASRRRALALDRLPQAPDRGAHPDFDVAIAGGGLSLLLAPLLADRGLRVAVFDRARVGSAHREWNAGERELRALGETGLFTPSELESLIIARYTSGLCRWHGGGTYPVTGVLDHAFDAGRLLGDARTRAERRGVAIFDDHTLLGHAAAEGPVGLLFETGRQAGAPATRTLSARILVDARGAASPYASADLICPTVGGVLRGLEEGDGPDRIEPQVGEILASTEGVDHGVQHIWEAFPGRPGEVTVYLFYYARSEDVGAGSLLELYARFFERLPRYKRGEARLLRPTFGYIPGWSRLGPAPSAPGAGVVLIGDAAARHSPLTFCGFGCALRSLAGTADTIARALQGGERTSDEGVVCDAPIHAGTGALARMMAAPSRDPAKAGEINELLDAAFGVLHGMGNEAYGALLRDEMGPSDFVRFLLATAALRPRVYWDIWGALGPSEVGRWGLGLVRELWRDRLRSASPRAGG